jgi:hypothetical protein
MKKAPTREQRAIIKEFCDAYGFTEDQIGFDGASLDPIFDFDALSALSLRLCNLPRLKVSFVGFDNAGLATASVDVQLANGAEREFFAL